MKSAVETLSPTRAKLTVEVPFEELKPSLDAAYKKIAQQINVPGFRRGKVPPMVIDRQVGRPAVLDEAINEALPKLYADALQANELQPLAQPQIDITKLDDNTTLEFTAEVDIRPEIEIPDYQGLEVTVDDVEVTDEEVEEQLRNLRERFATLHEVDRPAADRDFVVIDLLARQDGEPVEGAEATGMSYQVGSEGLIDGIDEALRGMSAGEEKTFTSRLVGGDQLGNEVDVEVKVSAVKEQELPEVDDEFAQTASEFDTVDELKTDIRTRLENGKRLEQAAAARDAVLERLLELVDIPLPDAMVEDEINARRESIEQQLGYAGISMQNYLDNEEMTIDEFEADLEKRVRDAVAAQFLLEEIARGSEIGVEQQELTEHVFRRAQQSNQDPNEFAKHIVEHNHIPEMVSEVVRGKALAGIVEAARVTDTTGNVVDLERLQQDGSLADPAAVDAGEAEAVQGEAGETVTAEAAEGAGEGAGEGTGQDS